jgi:hypothetical protein
MIRFRLARPPVRTKLRFMKTILPLALAAALLTGCAAIDKAERKGTEQQLAAAGFKVLPANTPERQTALTQLKPYTISRQIRGDKVFYVYPDPDGDFAYIGDQAAYAAYQQLVVQQQISDQNLMAAQMMDMPGPGMWPGWGYWGY